jgi:hypothetical protein
MNKMYKRRYRVGKAASEPDIELTEGFFDGF